MLPRNGLWGGFHASSYVRRHTAAGLARHIEPRPGAQEGRHLLLQRRHAAQAGVCGLHQGDRHRGRAGLGRLGRRHARIQTEKDRPGGDIIWGVSRSLLETNKAFFSPYASKNRDATPAEFREPADLWIGNNLHLMVILQNTKVLPEDQGPQDLGRPARSQVEGQDRLHRPGQLRIGLFDRDHAGRPFRRRRSRLGQGQAAHRQHRVLNRSSLVFQGVGNGEYPLGISLEYAGLCLGRRRGAGEDHLSRRRHDRADGRRRDHQGRTERGGRQGLRRLHQSQGRARDDHRRHLPAARRVRTSTSPSFPAACRPFRASSFSPTTRRHGRRRAPATLDKIKDMIQETR